MKFNGSGQAKVLTSEERTKLLYEGIKCQRDRTLCELCYYTACRISEARQLQYRDVFDEKDKVRSEITLRRSITKGKQATRSIDTHPKLADSLRKYQSDSRELVDIYRQVGDWDHKSFDCGKTFDEDNNIICPKCQFPHYSRKGSSRGKTIYQCKQCKYRFLISTAFVEHPELKDAVLRLGVENSASYGFLYLDPNNPYLFPGFKGKGCMSRSVPKRFFPKACEQVGITGAGTHSWRRTALTEMYRAGIPLKVIQSISGHKNLSNLQKYLEVDPQQVKDAINHLPSFPIQ